MNRTGGCLLFALLPSPTSRITDDDLYRIIRHYAGSHDHDDLLFVSQILTGFDALMRLGELVEVVLRLRTQKEQLK